MCFASISGLNKITKKNTTKVLSFHIYAILDNIMYGYFFSSGLHDKIGFLLYQRSSI